MSQMMSVSSLNTKIKSLLEATFMHTMVEGEVASLTYHSSGHLYFSIKDKESSIKCVMWRSAVAKMKFHIEKGMHIVVEGSVSVYTPRGEYQFQTVRIEPYGKGALALAYEQLKEKLKEKGYFGVECKKDMPKYIQKIALVTAKESAALYDMLKIIDQRWPLVEVVIVDTLVQGESASFKIVNALEYADSIGADVVVLSRGGGSAEDLWSFNEENVADAIFAMKTPIVSAVGHEVDVLISDFVADLRAPTPSAAMEMILLDKREILYSLSDMNDRFVYTLEILIQNCIQNIEHIEEMLHRSSPMQLLKNIETLSLNVEDELKRALQYKLEQQATLLPKLYQEYEKTMSFMIEQKSQYFQMMEKQLRMNNPKLQCKTGWAKVSMHHKTVALKELMLNELFVLEDEDIKVEAICVKKS